MKRLLLFFALCSPALAHDAVTVEELKLMQERFDLQLQAQESRINAAMAASEKAIAKAEMSMNQRMENMNEFRALN